MEREVLDTSTGGCQVRMQPVCASIGIHHGQVMLGGQGSEVGTAQILVFDDDLPSLIVSDSDEDDDDEGGSESSVVGHTTMTTRHPMMRQVRLMIGTRITQQGDISLRNVHWSPCTFPDISPLPGEMSI